MRILVYTDASHCAKSTRMFRKILPVSAMLSLLLLPPGLIGANKAGLEAPRQPPLLGVVHTSAPQGVLIQKIMPESAAERAGLKPGDILLSVNGVEIQNPRHLFTEVQRYSAGTIVSIDYVRAGQKKNLQVALGVRLNTAALVGAKSPGFTLPVYGSEAKFTNAAGTVYIIDFWATWCGACEPVRQILEDFQRKNKQVPIKIIGITSEDAATVKKFYGVKNPPYTILIDAASDTNLKFRVEGYPTLAVIDKKGTVRFAGFASGGGLEKALSLAQQLTNE